MRFVTLLLIPLLFATFVNAQTAHFTNPIYGGGYPDPSICRVGDDFYIVNSSFEYFPGLPIHHSRDLVNWELVAYGLHRTDQCTGTNNLVDVQQRGGIHAPTIRYHEGTFYIITTNVYDPPGDGPTQFINFIITAENIEGPWSEPHILEGAPGIDPDIFFDEDGKVWYAGTHAPENPNFNGEGEIWLQEIDLEKWELKGERHFLWRGACGGTWAEGPHIYRRDGRYYLLIAEGGTSFNHAVMIAVSDEITGPYIPNERNPVLTTRHLSYDNWVHSVGHADMVELADGRWYMVSLGIRGDFQRNSNMGRETHLTPVHWEREPFEWKEPKFEFPVVSNALGSVERQNLLPYPTKQQHRNDAYFDNFDQTELDLEWNFRRVPLDGFFSLTARSGFLRLQLRPEQISLRGRCSLLGIRQRETDFTYQACMEFMPKTESEEAGASLFLQDDNYIMYTVGKKGSETILQLHIQRRNEPPQVVTTEVIRDYAGRIIFQVESKNNSYEFTYSLDEGVTFEKFATSEADIILCNGYTGVYCGLYATSKGRKVNSTADFDWIKYKGYPR